MFVKDRNAVLCSWKTFVCAGKGVIKGVFSLQDLQLCNSNLCLSLVNFKVTWTPPGACQGSGVRILTALHVP